MSTPEALGGPALGMGPSPASRIQAVPVRYWGRWVASATCLALGAALLYALATNDNIDWGAVRHYFFDGAILAGLWVTIELTVLSMVIGVLLGTLFAIMRLSANPVLVAMSSLFTWFFRGTPLLVQIVFWFNIALLFPRLNLGLVDADTNALITPFMAALLGLALNEAAYMAEIVRAGISSVDRGQTEAAHALGFTQSKTMRRIVLPQAMRVIIPPTGNETISMLKNTSLVAVIAAQDLLTKAQGIYSRTFEVVELLIVASLWYLLLTTVASVGQYHIEQRFARGFRPTDAGAPTLLGRIRTNLRLGGGRS